MVCVCVCSQHVGRDGIIFRDMISRRSLAVRAGTDNGDDVDCATGVGSGMSRVVGTGSSAGGVGYAT